MSGFNFKQPASTGTTGSSLFGTTSNTSASSGGIFGGAGTGAGGTTAPTFSFGAPTTSSTTPSLFGAATSSPGTSLFGQTNNATSGPSMFGKKPDTNTTSEPAKPSSLFGSASLQSPATPSATASSLFGSSTPTTTAAPTINFSLASTTPAGAPPQANAFSASTGGSSLFGSSQNQNAGKDASKLPSFSFGGPSAASSAGAATATKPQGTPSLFGSTQPSSGGFFGTKPADQSATAASSTTAATEAPKPAFSLTNPASSTTKPASTPSLFGAVPTAAPTATTAAQSTTALFGSAPASQPAASGSLFGQPAKTGTNEPPKPTFSFPTVSSQPTTTAAPAQKSLFGAVPSTTTAASTSAAAPSLFKMPSTTTTTSTTSTNTTAPAPSGGLFSLGGASTSASTAAPTTATTSAPTGGLFALGGATTASTTTGTTAASTAAPAAAPATTGLGASTLGASTSGPAAPAQSRLRNKTLDEILTRWATDLTRYTKDFKSQAETIAHWDQIIVDNSSKIDKLYIKTRTCEKQTMSVEMQLAAVENQQNELEAWLSKYETDVDEMLAKDSTGQTEVGGPDQERERTYKLAERLGERLDDMGRDLESMVEQVNAANASLSKHTKADEPITQIVRILNSHLTQLQQIDQGTAALQAKVAAAQKSVSHLNYLNGSTNGDGRAAVDDFYRSYMGRR